MPTRVNVTEADIERSEQRDSRQCMIAEAIKRENPKVRNVLVDIQTIRWTDPKRHTRYVALTPEAAAVALVEFDQGRKVEPFSFGLKVTQRTPSQATVKDDGEQLSLTGKAPLTKSKRRRQVKRRGLKRLDEQGVIEGGEPPITAQLGNVRNSRNDKRQFGRRLLRE